MPFNFQERFQRELQTALHELAAREQRRSLAEIHGTNLCSNDYLELSRDPALKEAVERIANEEGEYRGRSGSIHVPAELDGIVVGVYGLDNRKVIRRRKRSPFQTSTG